MFRMTTLQASNTLEIISDVVCPWCYIGKRRLSRALALLGAETPLTVRWRAYELNPTMPPEGRDNAHPADHVRLLTASLVQTPSHAIPYAGIPAV
jgi:predicted DsbA family dithiol-disulfide isomerase